MARNIKSDSPWRKRIFEIHGSFVQNELRTMMEPKKEFMVKNVYHAVTCIANRSEATRYDIVLAVCGELALKGILGKHGNYYYFYE